MKFKKIVYAFVASWVVLSGGAPIITLAESPSDNNQTIQNSPSTTETPVAEPNSEITGTTESSVENTLDSTALSGDVNISENSEVSSAGTGDSSVTATVITVDNQSSDVLDTKIDSYSLNPSPSGNVDIVFTLESSASVNSAESQPTVIPLNTELETVNNTINIASVSGSLSADSNTFIGQLNTGDSYANANLINILGSNISAPEIFLGYITVNGDLKGDILLSDTLLQGINLSSGDSSDAYMMREIINYDLINTISMDAISGDLVSTENSKTGDLATGYATNILNAKDLVGLSVYGQTGMLVFVNVTGNWDGNIIGQSRGVVAALLGVNSINNPILIPLATNLNEASIKVNNSINISSRSGDISAIKNSEVGSMQTGSATTVVNLANVIGSNLVFTKNFGILFITIIGDWYGSLGVDTPYGGQKIILKKEEINSQTSNQNNTAVIKTKLSIHSNVEPEKFVTELISTAYDYEPSAYQKNITNEKTEANNNLAWLIPFIGGSIALGLVKANDKNKIKKIN